MINKLIARGLVLVAAVSLVLGWSARVPEQADAEPTVIVTYSADICTILLAGTAGDDIAASVPQFAGSCQFPNQVGGILNSFEYGGILPPNLDFVAAAASQSNGSDDKFSIPSSDFIACNDADPSSPEIDFAVDDIGEVLCSLDARDGAIDAKFELRPEDFDPIRLEGGQIHDQDGQLIVVAFFNDDGPVHLRLSDGVKFETSQDDDILCGSVASATTFVDEDCDNDGIQGDGAVAALIVPEVPAPDRGPASVSADQDLVVLSAPFTIVGEPDELYFLILGAETLEPAVQTGLTAAECKLPGDAAGFIAALGEPEKTVIVARVADNDGTEITGALLKWSVDDKNKAVFAAPLTPTLDLGGFGFGAPNLLCGIDDAGPITITAELLGPDGQLREAIVLDPKSASEFTTLQFKVVGTPADVALSVDPATVACDGTSSATVVATVTDAGGNPVVNGNAVDFDVQVLGTANPVSSTTADGKAQSVITPLSAGVAGVSVVVTAGDVQSSILVNCGAGAGAGGTQPGAGAGAGAGTTAPVSGVISGPDTGSGGDLDGGGSLAVWPAIALFMAAMGLAGARFGLRSSG